MKRLACLSLAVLLACSTNTTTSAVSLPGPNSLLVNGRTLLVANTSGAELKSLDLSLAVRQFVRAPNPLFPLSIPTAPFPRALAGTTAADGTPGPFAFALSSAGGQVTVVSSTTLAALGAVVVPDTSLAIAVTPKLTGIDEQLVVATVQGSSGALWTVAVPDKFVAADIKPTLTLLLGKSEPQVVAASPTAPMLVAVGDRETGPDGLGKQGGLALCDLAAKTFVRLDVGGPVMALAFAPSGTRLFGLLDTSACGAEAPCNGLFAVDLTDSAAPKLIAMLDIPGVARGLAVGGANVVTLNDATTPTIDPLVMVSSSDGSIYAVDGAAVQLLDNGNGVASAVSLYQRIDADGTITNNPPNGPVVFDDTGSLAMTLQPGMVRNEDLSFTYGGAVLRGTSATPLTGALVDLAFDFAARGVQQGDLVEFTRGSIGGCAFDSATIASVAGSRLDIPAFDTSCLARPVAYSVTSDNVVVRSAQGAPSPTGTGLDDLSVDFTALGVQPDDVLQLAPNSSGTCTANQVKITAVTAHRLEVDTTHFDPKCQPAAVVYSVRSRLTRYTVEGTRSGFQGRVGLGGTFHGAGISGLVIGTALPPLGTRFVISLSAGISQYVLPIAASTTGLAMPGAMAFDPIDKLFYAAYPGGNVVIEIDPAAMRASRADLGLVMFH